MAEPRILAFDTSGPWCAAALSIGGHIAAARSEGMVKGQAERLMPLLDEVMAEEGGVWRELDAVSVGVGPGNFTGVRIAVGAARGLALALGIPAIGVSAFAAVRETAGRRLGQRIMVVLPGARDTRYMQIFDGYDAISEPEVIELEADGRLGPRALLRWGNERATGLIASSSFPIAVALGGGLPGSDARPEDAWFEEIEVDAAALCRIAARRLAEGDAIPRPAPLYIRQAAAAPASDPSPVILS